VQNDTGSDTAVDTGPESESRVVARLRGPLRVHALEYLTTGLEVAYGPGTRLRQVGGWIEVLAPTDEERAEAVARAGQCDECGERPALVGKHCEYCAAGRQGAHGRR
jgi:hypothetical protein